ncbi:N-acetylglucosamine-6-phosphate deacetylase [Tahibacter amnicola]|uniref:N-acetylglucosamine-6-phosphate deacetylase n=1 Tax=Tahibacter amnicola TaxID=2976241 RepID=A0ABY6BI02_9GAMM|nr:N-acetylglucosamine-6-phosphate deacetylase [Tahibacter amnicola]UXI68968.1 N-acetylglucosamine-6-phosphate deacetylase [Tahibacter amnicola]
MTSDTRTTALIGARILGESGFIDDHAVLHADGRIIAVVPQDDWRVARATPQALHGEYLVPGFIDCQVNGGGDALFNASPTVDTIRRIGAAHRQFGTTGFLPTLISDDKDVMQAAIAAVADAIRQGVPGVLGIHLEGPYLSTARRGAHDASKFHRPDDSDLDWLATPTGGCTVLTLAPEELDAPLLRRIADRGILLCAGHTAATYAQTRAGLANGVRGFTHLFNAMTPLTSREPGVVGAALEDPDSWCGIIADGHHVHPASLRIALAAKPRGKVFLVTDAMPPVGGVQTSFHLGGQAVETVGGICRNADGSLAGSALDMASAVRNSVRELGQPLEEALRMASAYPAEFLGIAATRGRIATGQAADFASLDADLAVTGTWINGQFAPAIPAVQQQS